MDSSPPSRAMQGLFARAMRSSVWVAAGYAASQVLRLASNLILTRLLFPEAFGLMALVSVFLVGLTMFSDVGVAPAILQNKRGDDPEFLNTAWTIQLLRGVGLWLLTCAIALPAAGFYGEPMLAQLLPVGGLSLLLAGFLPTRIETANRHLLLGLVTALDLLAQVIGMLEMVALAWALQSVWALVLGWLLGSLVKLVLTHVFLPGAPNRLRWERPAAHELIHFGKWIFFSTACSFLLSQGDKAILGKYLSLDHLGIYNIGYFLASFPFLLGTTVIGRILIPLYRNTAQAPSARSQHRLRVMRFGLTGSLLAMLLMMAFFGTSLVQLLYDPRYAAAGAILVVIACFQIPQVIGLTYDQAALAAGDSRNFFYLTAARAFVQTALFLAGAHWGGLIGALIGQGVAFVAVYPVTIWLARRHKAWDPVHDVSFAVIGLALGSLAFWSESAAIAALMSFGAR